MVVTAACVYFAHATSDGLTFIATAVLGGLVLSFWLAPLRRRWFPPELEFSGEFQGLFYGATPDVDDSDASFTEPDLHQDVRNRVKRAKEIESSLKARPPIDHPAVSTLDDEHWTLEGVVLKAALIVLLVFVAWQFVRSILGSH